MGLVVAIDGPAGVGKTTVGRALADRLDATFLDTGVLYRALTLAAQEAGIASTDEERLAAIAERLNVQVSRPSVDDGRDCDVRLGDRDVTRAIRSREVEAEVSAVASHPGVRSALVPAQRRAATGAAAVVVGRDIGTVIFPDALVKIYLDASPEERARRRIAQHGQGDDLGAVAEALRARDEQDSQRAAAPLQAADDAVHVDTDSVSIDQVVDRIWTVIQERGASDR